MQLIRFLSEDGGYDADDVMIVATNTFFFDRKLSKH